MNKKTCYFTIADGNYLAQVQVFAESFKKHNDDPLFFFFINHESAGNQIHNLTFVDEIIKYDIPQSIKTSHWNVLNSIAKISEVATAIKGYIFRDLFEKYENVIYLDPDQYVLQNLNLNPLFDTNPILVTPHRSTPEIGQNIIRWEYQYLRAGIFNFGFLGLNRENDFLDWWIERLEGHCFDTRYLQGSDKYVGLFVDQKWGDFIPAYCKSYKVLDQISHGINVSAWSITDFDELTLDKIKTFHFSSGPKAQINCINRTNKRMSKNKKGKKNLNPTSIKCAQELCHEYSAKIREAKIKFN
jgi:hypothetical protein